MKATPLTQELDPLGLNGRRDNPIEEAERIKAKQKYVCAYAITHAGDSAAVWDAFDSLTSTNESSTRYVTVGVKVIGGGGHRGHDTERDKEGKWREYQAEVDALHKAYPAWSYQKLCTRAAKRFTVHRETVKSHTTNPRKK